MNQGEKTVYRNVFTNNP